MEKSEKIKLLLRFWLGLSLFLFAFAIFSIANSVRKVANQIPDILHTVNQTRDSLPIYLNQVDQIIDKVDLISQKAGKRASQGLVTGILTSPFAISQGLGEVVVGKKHIESADLTYIKSLIQEYLQQDKTDKVTWKNSSTETNGTIQLKSTKKKKDYTLKKIKVTFNNVTKKKKAELLLTYIKKEDGKWYIVE
ncbi:hypothetical protein [Aureibacter tunicatorum]|uniref:Uncharacterized protein n=1 Tax=Aureibacter tunicatorum TaxID=866807 RepID=A0AAE3XQ34_9BACT|nr:hypothetical protein [Aureibacter tunicatorum]MDR6240545.1 hypothetical protein [Aureibacter tunicatorum]BDD06594.1 hypothetical protein AUTU_40770 [Aureibacter tunicatorum]